MVRHGWAHFQNIKSTSFVPDLVAQASDVTPDLLMDMSQYRLEERIERCDGYDPLYVLVAYAQEELLYHPDGHIFVAPSREAYNAAPREMRINKFGVAYQRDSKLYLHKTLADIVVGAAIHLYQTQHWAMVLYDGLRTVDGAYLLYRSAADSDMEDGLLSLPGRSAHNKGLAVDSMMLDAHTGVELDFGGHFDHLDMTTNGRLYNGYGISAEAKENRRIREAAFLHSAFSQGLIVAPLRNEFWDDRLPENREDLWRVMESAARTIGITLLTDEDDRLYRHERHEFIRKWESWTYEDFLNIWETFFAGYEEKLIAAIGTATPPAIERVDFYHGNFNPIYDKSLASSGKNLTYIPPAA